MVCTGSNVEDRGLCSASYAAPHISHITPRNRYNHSVSSLPPPHCPIAMTQAPHRSPRRPHPSPQEWAAPLHVAAYNGHTEAVEALIAGKADVEAKDKVRGTEGGILKKGAGAVSCRLEVSFSTCAFMMCVGYWGCLDSV